MLLDLLYPHSSTELIYIYIGLLLFMILTYYSYRDMKSASTRYNKYYNKISMFFCGGVVCLLFYIIIYTKINNYRSIRNFSIGITPDSELSNYDNLVVKELLNTSINDQFITKELLAQIQFYKLGLAPRVVDAFEKDGNTYIIMETMQKSLTDYLNSLFFTDKKNKRDISFKSFLDKYEKATNKAIELGLKANENHLVHNDYRLDNIMVNVDPNDDTVIKDIKLIDFGRSKYSDNGDKFMNDVIYNLVAYTFITLVKYCIANNISFWDYNNNIIEFLNNINIQLETDKKYKCGNNSRLFNANTFITLLNTSIQSKLINDYMNVINFLLSSLRSNCLTNPFNIYNILFHLINLLIDNTQNYYTTFYNEATTDKAYLFVKKYIYVGKNKDTDEYLQFGFKFEPFRYYNGLIIHSSNKVLFEYLKNNSNCEWEKGEILGAGSYGSVYKVKCIKK